MTLKLQFLIFSLLVFASCNTPQGQADSVVVEVIEVVEEPSQKANGQVSPSLSTLVDSCQQQWKWQYPNDSLKRSYLNEIVSDSSNHLTERNRAFLLALAEEYRQFRSRKLVVEKILFPVFRLSEDEIGVFEFRDYVQSLADRSIEAELIDKAEKEDSADVDNFEKLVYYPEILDSIYTTLEKPTVNLFTPDTMITAQIKDLGFHFKPCFEYFQYSFKINEEDSLLFGSTLAIDLIPEKNAEVDSLISQQVVKRECYDCPSSQHLLRTFAKIDGTDNLYFVYADTFPLNNKLDTPSRGLVLVKSDNRVVYLWYSEIDLFGCSCL